MLLLAGFHGGIDDFGLFFISNLQASAPPPLIDWALRGVNGPKTRSKNFISGHYATLRPLPQPDPSEIRRHQYHIDASGFRSDQAGIETSANIDVKLICDKIINGMIKY